MTAHISYADEVWNNFNFLIHIPAVVDRYENEKARKQKLIADAWRELSHKTYSKPKAVAK